jgi:ferredoxin-like protein FixX
MIFNSKAEDLISMTDKPNKLKIAKYPLAPPCPTDAYNVATIKIKIGMRNCSILRLRKQS